MSAILPDRWLRLVPAGLERDVRLARGEGVHVWDDEERRYLDLGANHGAALLGHSHPAVLQATWRQLERMAAAHRSFEHDARDELVEALSLITPEPLSDVLMVNSGSEAVDAALLAARLATGRRRVVAMDGASHGVTAAARAVSDVRSAGARRPGRDTVRVPFGDAQALDDVLDESVAAIIVEPIQVDAGVRVAPPGYLAAVGQRCRRAGVLLILDEVQTALRTGSLLASSCEGVVPDMLCLARGLANGLPLGVLVMRQDVARALPQGWHDGGDAGNPVVCAAAAATIRLASDPTMQARGATAGDHLMRRLEALRISEIRGVRGRGLLAAVELRHSAAPVLRLLQERGVLAIAGGGGLIRFMPPLTIERRDIDTAVEALAWSIRTSRGSQRPAPPGSVSLRGVARRPAHAAPS